MTDALEYDLVRAEGRFELRQYPAVVLVAVEGLSDNAAFGILFDYISGNNRARRRIPMTAPVVSRQGLFAFVLPKDYTLGYAPMPLDPRARLVSTPPRKLAVLRFRGHASHQAVRARTMELRSWTGRAGLTSVGEPFLMRYNPPFTPGFLRRNEVAVEVEP